MSLTEYQLSCITTTERICSSISLAGASIVVITFVSQSAFRKPINRLIFYAMWGNILLSIGTTFGRVGTQAGTNSHFCQFQAFLLQWFFPADAVWALCIAWNVYLRFIRRFDSKQLQRLEWKYIVICYSIPLIPAIALLFIETAHRGKVYGSATYGCWIAQPWEPLRIALLYGPVWVIILIIFAIYIRVGLYIYFQLRQLRPVETSSDWSAYVGDDINRIRDSTATEGIVMEQTQSRQYLDSGPDQQDTQRRQTLVPNHSARRSIGRSGLTRIGSSSSMAAWAYATYAFLFFIALLVTWAWQVPPTMNRISTLIKPSYVSFGFNYAAGLVIPLQGFWNSLIYTVISRKEFKNLYSQFRDWLSRKRMAVPPHRLQRASEMQDTPLS